jgi:hypothetical protein
VASHNPAAFLAALYPVAEGTYSFSLSDAVATMVHCRELLELRSAQAQYPILNLYCNWTVHTELEGSAPAYRALIEATNALLTSTDPAALGLNISKCLSFHQLRSELIALFKAEGISPHFFETVVMWKEFAGQLLKSLIGKRLMFPANPAPATRAARAYADLVRTAGPRFQEAAKTLQLVQSQPGNEVHWQIERMDGSVVSGAFQNTEQQSAFQAAGFYVDGKPGFHAPR